MNTQDKKLVYILVGLPVLVFTLFIGIYIGGKSVPFANNPNLTNTEMVKEEQFAAFWKAWKVLDEKFVTAASTTNQEKVYGSIQGLASSYKDPYTVFFPPAEAKIFNEDIAGGFEGVGMEIGIKDKQLQVVAPLKDSPADRAGIKTGDLILSINGTSTINMAVDQAVKYIRGPKGSKVVITFLTKGSTKPIDKTIIRDVITIPTIETSVKQKDVFVIRLFSFSAQSPNLFRNALREFVESGHHKLILDLRGNPGGYLDAAWDMASYFLPAGKVVTTEDFGKNRQPNIFRSKGYNIFGKDLKMIILVDGGSASASEILAGALKEHGIARLVGSKTFGKGSVQELVSITSDTSLKITVARWLTPLGHNLSHEGLEPDFDIPVTQKDIDAKTDPQMEKALQLLSVEI